MKVVTVDELKKLIRNNEEDKIDEIDVVTTATCGIMSGTSGIFHLNFNTLFRRAKKIFFNDIEGVVGVCPNEYLGRVDCIFFGEVGFLFKDIVKGKDIDVKVITDEGKEIEEIFNIEKFETAKMIGTRFAFKNYLAFTSNKETATIFHRFKLKIGEASFSGCGEINPLENMIIKDKNDVVGLRGLLNGAECLVLGFGTRSSLEKPNLMISANMKDMDSYYLGGFLTSGGIEIYNTVALPVDVRKHREALKKLDKDIPLPLVNLFGREIIDYGKYSDVWENVDLRPKIYIEKCKNCNICKAEESCPTNAIKKENNKIIITEDCFGCGVCGYVCEVFKIRLGEICGLKITCRQSDRKRALKLAKELKKRIIKGELSI
ncbi:methanogenesis marker 16 metalloprotein [Methanocaldococcus indicus]|uniref:methanogenesis marker 16 metalloprotein n=1 Tax=Methanocaldococcus indicus TaxID=213231 RepID=UPI003C6D5DE6